MQAIARNEITVIEKFCQATHKRKQTLTTISNQAKLSLRENEKGINSYISLQSAKTNKILASLENRKKKQKHFTR